MTRSAPVKMEHGRREACSGPVLASNPTTEIQGGGRRHSQAGFLNTKTFPGRAVRHAFHANKATPSNREFILGDAQKKGG